MVILRTLLMLCGALAVLTLGALPAAASGPVPPPCHEMSGMIHGVPDGVPTKAPDKPMKVMGCCIICVAASLPSPISPAAAPLAGAAHRPLTAARLTGHSPAPEHGPPRA